MDMSRYEPDCCQNKILSIDPNETKLLRTSVVVERLYSVYVRDVSHLDHLSQVTCDGAIEVLRILPLGVAQLFYHEIHSIRRDTVQNIHFE